MEQALSISAIFFLFGSVSLGISWHHYKVYRVAKNWPVAFGRVIRASVEERLDDGDVIYRADIAFTYTVGGVVYTADRVRLDSGSWSSLRFRAERRIRRYPIGSPITVYYCPKNPAASVVEKTFPSIFVLLAAIGTTLLCVGMLEVTYGILR